MTGCRVQTRLVWWRRVKCICIWRATRGPAAFFFALFWKWILDFRAAASSRQADFEARLERVRERED